MHPMIEDLCDAVDAASLMRHVEEFARRVKLSGTPEELESLKYVTSQLGRYGFRTELILHDAYISLPGAARLEAGGQALDCITHSFSRASGPGGLRRHLVYAGYGTPDDFAGIDTVGKIVLLESIANPAASLRASQAGAAGQIHISPLENLYEMCISPVWGSPTPDQVDLLPKTVVLSVRNADGAALRARLQSGEAIEATLHAEVDTGWRKTPILEARLDAITAGREPSFVLFSGHHDTWYYGVMDNGTANATMLEVARLFAQRQGELKRGLRLCFWSGHSHGRYSGSSWYADAKFGDLARHCAAHVNVDSVGAKGNTVLADALSSNELFAVAAEAVRQQGGQELDGHRMSRAGDQSFWGIGIPSVFMAMGEQPAGEGESVMGPAIGGGGSRKGAGFGWWWHTPDDTIDKIDPDLLVRDVRIYVHTIGRLLTDDVLPLDIGRQADALARELSAIDGGLAGRLDVGSLQTGVAALRVAALQIRTEGGDRAGRVAAINQALVKASRALVPMDYTSGDRFRPDPALKQGAYPVLDPVRALAATTPGSDASRFASVAAQRALNRIAVAVEEATAALATCG